MYTERGIELSNETSELISKYINKGIDEREVISILIHMAKLQACRAFQDYYTMVGCLSDCLHENLPQLFEKIGEFEEMGGGINSAKEEK